MDLSTLSLRDAALEYARRGWRVLPVSPNGKLPMLKDWPNKASNDPETVSSWWNDNSEYNIGIACGDIVVVDVDGEVGEDSLACIQLDNEILPETLECRTGTGRHLYFKCSEELGNTASNLQEHLDTRGKGGMVVAPPSIHPNGAEYTWINDVELADLPQWVIDKLRQPPPAVYSPPVVQGTGETFTLHRPAITVTDQKRVRGFLDNWAREARFAPQGQRNKTLNIVTCKAGNWVAGGYLNEMEVREVLYQAGIDAGLDDYETRATLDSGMRRGLREPRYLPSAYKSLPTQVLTSPAKGKFLIKAASEYEFAPEVETWWDGRIVRGYITVLGGRGGIGKSAITGWVSAALTSDTSSPLGWDKGPEVTGDVLLVSYEDNSKLILNRTKTLGGDPNHVFVIEGRKIETDDGTEMAADITADDIEFLEVEIRDSYPNVAMVVFDPWKTLVVDINSPDIVNPVTQALQRLAQRLNVAVVVVAHWNSRGSLAGYSGLRDTARSVLECWEQEALPGVTKVVMAHTKHNLTAEAPPLTYEFKRQTDDTGRPLGWHTGDNPFTWTGESTLSADILRKQCEPTGEDKAIGWLHQTLSSGDRPANEVECLAVEDGIKAGTLRAAKVRIIREYHEDGVLMWTIQ